MKVKGDTIIFKSEYEPFVLEWSGKKANTVRKIPPNELHDFLKWSEESDNPTIQIVLANAELYKPGCVPPERAFVRDVTNVYELGQILGEPLFVISWRHPE